MRCVDVPREHKKPVLLRVSTEPQQSSFDGLARTMHSTPPPRPMPGSEEELTATQARLYKLLVEATDRLQRERGLPRTRAAEVARLNGHANGSDSSDEKSDNKDCKGPT
jgi:hypothetical protein